MNVVRVRVRVRARVRVSFNVVMTKQQLLSAFANPHCGIMHSQIRPILVKVRAVDVQVVHFCRQDLLEQLHVMRLLAEVGIYESGQEPV